MNNQALHDFIKEELQDTTTDYVFGGESYWSYFNGALNFKTPNQITLRIDEKEVIPFTIASYESEKQPLQTVKIQKYTLPIVFSIKYGKKDEWIPLLETFSDSLNGKQFTIESETIAFGTTGISQNGNSAELNADDWFQVTLTVYGYSGNVYKGNGMTYSFNGVEIEPLNYASTMQNDLQYYVPSNSNIGKNKSNGKQRTKSLVLYYLIGDADTIVEEIEGTTLNNTYAFIVTYPSGKSYTSTVMIDRGTSTVVNGDGILFEVVIVDA
jgi:hypothetical protein